MSRTVVVRAPTRLDFGGGWTDVSPYAEEIGGFVCNVAISRYATVSVSSNANRAAPSSSHQRGTEHALVDAVVRHLGVTDAEVRLSSDFPLGAGLGGSSAAGVAAVSALSVWQGTAVTLDELAETSRAVETGELGIAGGRQDHYAAAYGGALALRFGAQVSVRRIALSAAMRSELARCCILIYTGQSRISAETIVAVLDAYKTGERSVVLALRRMRELAEEMPAALEAADVACLGHLVAEQWTHQRALHPRISTPAIDAIVETARGAGAIGAKALGASGGGCVLVVAAPDRVDDVRNAIAPLGEILPYDRQTRLESRNARRTGRCRWACAIPHSDRFAKSITRSGGTRRGCGRGALGGHTRRLGLSRRATRRSTRAAQCFRAYRNAWFANIDVEWTSRRRRDVGDAARAVERRRARRPHLRSWGC